jgi:hypothetical protein
VEEDECQLDMQCDESGSSRLKRAIKAKEGGK